MALIDELPNLSTREACLSIIEFLKIELTLAGPYEHLAGSAKQTNKNQAENECVIHK